MGLTIMAKRFLHILCVDRICLVLRDAFVILLCAYSLTMPARAQAESDAAAVMSSMATATANQPDSAVHPALAEMLDTLVAKAARLARTDGHMAPSGTDACAVEGTPRLRYLTPQLTRTREKIFALQQLNAIGALAPGPTPPDAEAAATLMGDIDERLDTLVALYAPGHSGAAAPAGAGQAGDMPGLDAVFEKSCMLEAQIDLLAAPDPPSRHLLQIAQETEATLQQIAARLVNAHIPARSDRAVNVDIRFSEIAASLTQKLRAIARRYRHIAPQGGIATMQPAYSDRAMSLATGYRELGLLLADARAIHRLASGVVSSASQTAGKAETEQTGNGATGARQAGTGEADAEETDTGAVNPQALLAIAEKLRNALGWADTVLDASGAGDGR